MPNNEESLLKFVFKRAQCLLPKPYWGLTGAKILNVNGFLTFILILSNEGKFVPIKKCVVFTAYYMPLSLCKK